jgi:hypothetical protein
MDRTMQYRRMALTASTPEVREALIRVAIRYVTLATHRKKLAMGPGDG